MLKQLDVTLRFLKNEPWGHCLSFDCLSKMSMIQMKRALFNFEPVWPVSRMAFPVCLLETVLKSCIWGTCIICLFCFCSLQMDWQLTLVQSRFFTDSFVQLRQQCGIFSKRLNAGWLVKCRAERVWDQLVLLCLDETYSRHEKADRTSSGCMHIYLLCFFFLECCCPA